MRRGPILLSIVCASLLSFAPAALASKRVALVVGIDAYDNLSPQQQLKKAASDARTLGETLQGLGYQVIVAENADRRSFNESWQKFLSAIGPGDEVAFFFAGHGVEISGQNFLLPRDVPKPQSGEALLVKNESLSVTQLMGDLQEKAPQVSLIILDACRDNPFAAEGTRSIGGTRGLARVEAPEGTFVMYSAAAGQAALDRLSDSDDNPNSVFTRSLVPLIKTKGLGLQEVALKVREQVAGLAIRAGHKQVPAYYDQLTGRFCVAGCEAAEPSGGLQAKKQQEISAVTPYKAAPPQDKPVEAEVDLPSIMKGNSIELDALIQLYMIPTGASYNILGWDTGSAPGTPIVWNHAGIKECEPYIQEGFGTPLCRSGSVQITIGGVATHSVLGKVVEPGRWNVRLMGAHAGVSYVSIESDVNSQELDAGLLTRKVSKLLSLAPIKKCGGFSDGAELFRVTSLKRQPGFLRESWSCGSGGCAVSLVVTSTEQEALKLMGTSECPDGAEVASLDVAKPSAKFVSKHLPPEANLPDFSAAAVSAVDLSKIRFSETRQLFPDVLPEIWRIIVSNVGTQNLQEITIGYRGAPSREPCSANPESYDGVKKFNVRLGAGDSVTLQETFSQQAKQFCIVSAR